MMRAAIVAMALATALVGSWAVPATAQNNGIVIQNNGVDSSDSAAGADNVRISRSDGASSSNNGAGVNNEVMQVERAPKDRTRKDRSDRNNNQIEAPADAPAEAAPAEGDYQAYDEGAPAAAPEAAPQEIAQPATGANAPIKLPNTGSGTVESNLIAAVLTAMAAAATGAAVIRRRRLR